MYDKNEGVFIFAIVIVVIMILATIVFQLFERKKRKDLQNKFKSFSDSYKISKKNLRAVPRVLIPHPLGVFLTLTDDEYFGLKANAMDMSLTGFSVKPDFPLKRLPIDAIIKNVLVVTPINTFVIKEMKPVRIDHHIDRRLMAFHIEKIDEDQFESLKHFISYLDEFLKKKYEEERTA
jgi:hypothetical protein